MRNLYLQIGHQDKINVKYQGQVSIIKQVSIKMINPLFLPQHSKRRRKTTIQEVSQQNSTRRQFKLIHQLDCIYQGQINQSYQKQGFGIQQTNDFNTYIGYWKSGKANGIGMIIFPDGGLVYGIGLIDNKLKLRIGQFQNLQITGIGFEYVYAQTKWKLSRFHKGVSIETVSETISSLENGVPSMISLHQDMQILLSRYLNQQYFDISYKSFIERPYRSYTQMNVHKIANNYLYFGQVVQGKYWGLGLIYDKKNGYPIEIGYYQMGELNGYAVKIDKDKNKTEIGLYKMGKKQGFFYEKTNNLQVIAQYQRNYLKGQNTEMNRQKIKNLQKIYNYQKNDFYSEKNKIQFQKFKDLLNRDQKELLKLNQTLKQNLIGAKSKQKPQKSQKIHSDKKSVKYMAPQTNVYKSTVQVMKQKLNDIENIIKRSKAMMKDEKQKKEASPKKTKFLQVNPFNDEQKPQENIEDGEIEQQYVPVNKNYQPKDFPKENTYRKHSPWAQTPKSQRRIRSPSRSPVNNTTGQKRTDRIFGYGEQIKSFTPFTDNSANISNNDRSVSKRKKRRIFQ